MLRALLLYLSHAKWARDVVMKRRLAQRVTRRFVSGETEDEAIEVIRRLNSLGIFATVDILGESTTNLDEARHATNAYLHLITRISREKLLSWISIKLTALGLDIDLQLCLENMQRILHSAREHDIYVTIDMENHSYTQRTIDLFHDLRAENFNNVRIAIQSYLYRSEKDIITLVGESAGIRLCKGGYKEPISVAYPKKRDVDAAYLRQMKILLKAAKENHGYPGIATHDIKIIEVAKSYATENNIPHDCFEFQMLYGIRTVLQEQLAAEGYRMRIYVPFGTQWYPYFIRRLAERPANLWFFVSNFLRR
ncbi:MAG: proline dehydrogenase family protein [Candidatus Heimdallarchaeota archaeon]